MLYACLNIHTKCLYIYMQILVSDKITDLYSSFLCSVYIIWQFCSAVAATFPTIPYQQKPCLSLLFVFYLSADFLTSRAGLSLCESEYCQELFGKKKNCCKAVLPQAMGITDELSVPVQNSGTRSSAPKDPG